MFCDTAKPTAQPNLFSILLPFGIIFILFYLLLIRPQRKQQKKLQAQRNALKKGLTVVAMGIVGTVHEVKEGSVIIVTAGKTQLEVLKAGISDVRSGIAPNK